jgi:hypothetical protein
MILGGRKQDGDTASVYGLNLKDLTLGSYPGMNGKRCIPKGYLFNGMIYVLGGNANNDVEQFDFAMHE